MIDSTQSHSQRALSREEVITQNKTYCKKQSKSYYDYEQETIVFNSSEPYELIAPLGRGKYSEVFEAIDYKNDKKVVVKFLKPVRYPKILREIKILQAITEGPHIIHLLDICKDQMSNTPALIFEHFSSSTLKCI